MIEVDEVFDKHRDILIEDISGSGTGLSIERICATSSIHHRMANFLHRNISFYTAEFCFGRHKISVGFSKWDSVSRHYLEIVDFFWKKESNAAGQIWALHV